LEVAVNNDQQRFWEVLCRKWPQEKCEQWLARSLEWSTIYCYLFKKTTMLALEIPDFEQGMVVLTAGSDPCALIPD
jgi:hypothetical protein